MQCRQTIRMLKESNVKLQSEVNEAREKAADADAQRQIMASASQQSQSAKRKRPRVSRKRLQYSSFSAEAELAERNYQPAERQVDTRISRSQADAASCFAEACP